MQKLDKLTLLKLIKEQPEPISSTKLLQLLGPQYAERTLRRYLADMIEEGLIIGIGLKKGTRYAIKPSEKIEPPIFSHESIEIINRIKQPIFKRSPVSYHSEWLDHYQPNVTHYLPMSMQDELFKIGKRSKNHEPAGTYAHHIYNRLLIDLSYNSSRLEGNTYSLLETKKLLIDGIGVQGKLDEEKIMILNHKDAIRYLVDNADKIEINENEILTLQFLLSDGLVSSQHAGKIRDHGVRISSSTYIPLENPTHLAKQLHSLCQKAALIHSPYEKSFFLLVHIAYLQAFVDVNKRTSRLSANIPLIQNNLVPLSFNDITRDDYTSAMISIYEHNDILPLQELYYYSYLRTCELYDATIEAMGFDEIRVLYRQQRRNLIRSIIINKLVRNKLENFIQTQTLLLVKEEHQQNFIEDVKEDLNMLSAARIVGMGVTLQQLEEWIKSSR